MQKYNKIFICSVFIIIFEQAKMKYTSMWTRAKHGLEFRHTQKSEYCDLSNVT